MSDWLLACAFYLVYVPSYLTGRRPPSAALCVFNVWHL